MTGPLSSTSAHYPARLARVADAPRRLHWRGSASPRSEAHPVVAVVGARAASGEALEMAAAIAAAVAGGGGMVVSGGALGVDAAAHRGALRAGGETLAVLAAGFEHLYPAVHRPLFAAIERRGALLTPYDADVPPRRFHFVRRNRIIAGLSDVVVVVGASRSSGSLYTARAARDYGRALAAVPGSPGCEALIAEGAIALRAASDVLAIAEGTLEAEAPTAPAGELERLVLESLGRDPVGVEELSRRIGWGARDVDRALVGLEMARLALALPGREYVRSTLGEALGR